MIGCFCSIMGRPNWGIGQRSERRWAACLRSAVLALTVIVPVYPAERASAASATLASQGGFTQDQLDGLAYLNEIHRIEPAVMR
ncbi:hypothetical protein BK141_21260 [Paenibacillus sp. FSL R5-0765]|nr:hypothetical protein BK141_21260 [Paenibacillus sp. FSL R5-0765]